MRASRICKFLLSTAIACWAVAGSAQAALVISSKPTKNLSCSAGVCTATGKSAVMNVGELTTMLASSDVTVASGTKAQDIEVKVAFSWASASRLTLDAYRSITIEKLVTVAGSGALTLTTNDGGANGTLSFTPPGRVHFWDLSSSLLINGASYTLVGDIATLASDIAGNPSGRFALAKNYDASVDGNYAHAPIPTALTGIVEGLGNSITKLTIKDATAGEDVGLFASVAPSGSVNDLLLMDFFGMGGKHKDIGGLAGMNAGVLRGDSVKGTIRQRGNDAFSGLLVGVNLGMIQDCHSAGEIDQSNGFNDPLGGLVGFSQSLVDRSDSSVAITSVGQSPIGGLVGMASGGAITNSFATGAVTSTTHFATAGGLLGVVCCNLAAMSIANSYATGAVAGNIAGGLVGELGQAGVSIVNSHASGDVSAASAGGGLVGSQAAGTIVTGSHATGNVSGYDNGGNQIFGGLVGVGQGTIEISYAEGNVVLDGSAYGQGGGLVGLNDGGIDRSFATGAVSGANNTRSQSEGGLVGFTGETLHGLQATIVNSYATGAVDGVGSASDVGGLAGGSHAHSFISDSYEVGAVSGGARRGGFIGVSQTETGHDTNDYWDTTTSGASQGVGQGNADGITGLTAAQLQSGLPAGFDPSIWAQNPSVNNGYPYLIANPPP